MLSNFIATRRTIAVNVTNGSIRKLTNIIHRSLIRALLSRRSFLNVSLSVQNLTLRATRQLISRRPQVQRTMTLTNNATHGRRNARTTHLASANNQSIKLSRLRNIMSKRPNDRQTAQQISMRVGILLKVFDLRRRRLNGRRINRMILSLTSRRSSPLLRRTQVSIMNTLTTNKLLRRRKRRTANNLSVKGIQGGEITERILQSLPGE